MVTLDDPLTANGTMHPWNMKSEPSPSIVTFLMSLIRKAMRLSPLSLFDSVRNSRAPCSG